MARRTDTPTFLVVDDVFTNVTLIALVAAASAGALFVTASHLGRTALLFRYQTAGAVTTLAALVAHYHDIIQK